MSSSIYKNKAVLHLKKNWGHLPFPKILRPSSIFKEIEVVFHSKKKWGRLPFSKKLRSSSNLKNEVVFHFLIFEVVFYCQKIEVVFHFKKKLRFSSKFDLVGLNQCCIPIFSSICCWDQNWGHLPFEKNWGRLPF